MGGCVEAHVGNGVRERGRLDGQKKSVHVNPLRIQMSSFGRFYSTSLGY